MDASLAMVAATSFAAGSCVTWLAARARARELAIRLEHAAARAADRASDHQAREQLDDEQRRQAIAEIVAPVHSTLERVGQRVEALDRERSAAFGMLAGQVQQLQQAGIELRRETGNLVKALRQPAGRGRWGELQLQRVAELAGMLEQCDFHQQQHVAAGDHALRPDMVVRLPNRRCVVVDAKVPLDAYVEAMDAPDDDAALPLLERHADAVRTHVRDLAGKRYADHCDGAPGFVVLFLPGEHFFSAALQQRPALIEEAARLDVVIATPTTLLAMLRAVGHGWKEERLAANAAEICELGAELYRRVAGMAGHVARLGRQLDKATEAYNATVGSLERRVLPQARRMHDLDAGPGHIELPTLATVDERSRPLSAPELHAAGQ